MRRKSRASITDPSDRRRFEKAIGSVRGDGVIITTHEAPDADGIGSAFAIAEKIRSMGKAAEIVGGPLIAPVAPLAERLGLELKGWDRIPRSDRRPVIIVDTSNPYLLSGLRGRKNRVILLIDHHQRNEEVIRADERIENASAISASEIVASLLERKDLDRMSALALAVGIASDSERLNNAELSTLRLFTRLLSLSGESKKRVDELAYPPLPHDTLAAVMQDMKALRVETHKGRVISAGPTMLAMPSVFADALRAMGASVSAGIAQLDDGWARVSIRVGVRDALERGIHANRIAYRTSELCRMPKKLRGGGHADKGGAHIRGSIDRIIEAVIAAAKQEIDRAR